MKKDVHVTVHLEDLIEFKDVLSKDFSDGKTYYLYPTFWNCPNEFRSYLSLCITECENDFSNCVTIFPPDAELFVDLYIQLGNLLEIVRDTFTIFKIEDIQYKDA